MNAKSIIYLITFPAYFFAQSPKVAIETVFQNGHQQPVSCAAFHPSGSFIATAGIDNAIKIWDVNSGKIIRSINVHTANVNNLEFSKDGSQILSSATNSIVFVVETLTGNVVEKYAYDNYNVYPTSVAFSKNEENILLGDNRDNLVVFDRKLGTQKIIKKGFSAHISSRSQHPTSNYLLAHDNYKGCYLVKNNSDSTFIPFEKAYNYEFSPDGTTFCIASAKLFAQVFSTETGGLIGTLIPNEKDQCDGCNPKITYSSDGKNIAFMDRYSGLSIWEIPTLKKVFSLDLGEERFESLKFSPDNSKVLLNNSETCKIIEIASKKAVFLIENRYLGGFNPVFSPDSKTILTSSERNTVSIYAISKGDKRTQYKGLYNEVKNDNLTYDYSRWTDTGILKLLKSKTPFEINGLGTQMAVGKIDTSLVVVDLNTGKPKFILKGHRQQVTAVKFSPDAKIIASGDAEGILILWEASTGKLIKKQRAHSDVIFSLAFNSDGNEILSSSWDGGIKHWNAPALTLVNSIQKKSSSSFVVNFSDKDLYVLAADLENKLFAYESDSKELSKTFIGHTNTISSVSISSKTKKVLTGSWDGTAKIWDFNTATIIDKIRIPENGGVLSAIWSADESKIYLGSNDRNIYVYDAANHRIVKTFKAHQSGVTQLQIHPTENTLISRSAEGDIKFWNIEDYSEKLMYMQMTQDDWLISEPNGFFDGTQGAMKRINYVSEMKALEVGSFFKKYYTPGLYKQIQSGQRIIDDNQGINSLMDDIPTLNLEYTNSQKTITTINTDSVYNHQNSTIEIMLSFAGNTKNIHQISAFNNGKLVHQEKFNEEISFRGNANSRVASIKLSPNLNELSFSLTTKDGITTTKKQMSVYFDTISGRTELFVLALGINKYDNSAYNLKYAKNDAEAFTKTLSLSAKTLFQEVYVHTLTDSEVTKEKVTAKFNELIKKMGPEDVFVFYYAGHGMMCETKDARSADFYLIMSDITNLYGDKTMLDAKGISANDLLDFSKRTPAQKQVFVLDACQSGAALNALAARGVEREKTLAQLARNSGTFFLTASQDVEYANEVGELKHGIFTYAILEMLSGENNASKDQTISVYQLKSYVENRVPELSKIHKGSAQYPTGYSFGNDFPIGIVGK